MASSPSPSFACWRGACCSSSRWAILGLLALLAGCGDLPRPFAGHPGATALRLAQPPPARLAVPVPTNALLSDEASAAYDKALVTALQDQDVPAVADIARTGDWRLTVTADVRDDKVVPVFTVENPSGDAQGSTEGAAVDAAQWAAGSPPTLQSTAAASAPLVATLLTRIEAQRQQSDPNSLINRPARVLVADVTGAPGDGNQQLARNLREQLPQVGEVVQDTPAGADFVVACEVKTAPGSGGTERIEIQWIVRDARGRELGRVVQLNEVAPGSLDRYWGDTALVVAQEASGGVRDVILNQLGARADAKAAKPAQATGQ
jgi:hypothetical protein